MTLLNLDSVTKNYNTTGTVIMEMIYGDDYLSPGGVSSTEALADLGQISNGQRILDVGCGIGGAAFYLAEQRGCSIHGIDLMHSNVRDARRRANERGLSDCVGFSSEDAISLPFESGTFDVVWGQDAWCHVDDKKKLISEAARVLAPHGKLVFSDWLLGDPGNPNSMEVQRITASPNMGDAGTYQTLLQDQGFELEIFVDTSTQFVLRYRDVIKRLLKIEAELCNRFGREVFAIVLSKQQFVLGAFETGAMVFGSFVALHRD